MKILILDTLSDSTLLQLLSNNVIYRPDLLSKNRKSLGRALVALGVDAVVTSVSLPSLALQEWASSTPQDVYWVRVALEGGAQALQAPSFQNSIGKKWASDNLQVLHVQGQDEAAVFTAAFETLEHRLCHARAKQLSGVAGQAEPVAALAKGSRVLLVGAGLVNLITAHELQLAGYAVELVDAGPDPRCSAVWTAYGCSRGGDDARMFTLSEMDNYNDRQISTEMNGLFQRSVNNCGWGVRKSQAHSFQEQAWISEFEDIPIWLANRYNQDIFSFNQESWPLWQQWIQGDPELFELSLLKKNILRLYSDPAHYQHALVRQNSIGATQQHLSPQDVASMHPGLRDAVDAGHVAGGIQVHGFTVNAHKFIHGLLDRLEQGGAKFMWDERIQSLVVDAQENVKGVRGLGKTFQATHYVVCPGVYGGALLNGTRSSGKIHGVLGAWLRLPNLQPQLQNSLKLARKNHITEDANITVASDENGNPILIIGSGYGYTGIHPDNIDQARLHDIYQGLVDTAQNYFPQAYQAALEAGTLQESFKYCVRPWTASSLGIFEIKATHCAGRCIITGGHNTGGFAQAPSVAKAVLAALSGRQHPMHQAYDPDRTSAFLGSSPGTPVLDANARPLQVANA